MYMCSLGHPTDTTDHTTEHGQQSNQTTVWTTSDAIPAHMAYTLTPASLQQLTTNDLAAAGSLELAAQARLPSAFAGTFTAASNMAAAAATSATAHYTLRPNETWPQGPFYDHSFNAYASASGVDSRRVSPDRTGNTLGLAVVPASLGKHATSETHLSLSIAMSDN